MIYMIQQVIMLVEGLSWVEWLQCDDCPGWDNDLDVNGQTICNAKGTCNPLVDALDNYVGMGCACTTDIETGQKWTGDFCQCLKTAPPSSTLLNIVNTPLTNIWIDGTVNYTINVSNHYIDISKWPDNTIYNDMKYNWTTQMFILWI